MAIAAVLKAEVRKLFAVEGIPWERLMKLFAAAAGLFCLMVVFVSPWKVMAFFLGCGLFAFVWVRPAWVLMFLAAYIPFEPFLLKFVPDELYVFAKYFSEGLIYLLLGTIFFRRWWNREKRPSTPIDLPFALLVLTCIASAVANFSPVGTAVLGIRQIVRFVLLFYAVVALSPSRAFIRKLAVLMLAVALFQSLLGIAQAVTQGGLDTFLIPSERRVYDSIQLTGSTEQFWSPGQRVFGTLGRYDQLGTFLTFFLLLLVGWFYAYGDARRRRWILALLGAGCVALVLTYSRASWFGFLLGFLLIAVRYRHDKRILIGVASVAIAIAAYTVYSGVVVRYLTDLPEQSILARLLEAFSYERWRGEYFGFGRVYWFVQTPLTVVAAAPVFGHGPGQFGAGAAAVLGNTGVYDALGLPFGVYGTEGYIDNNWFALWGEIGTLGLALYVWMFVALYRAAARLYRASKDPLLAGLGLGFLGATLAFAFQALLGSYLEVRTIGLYFWLFAGLIVVSLKRELRAHENPPRQ